LVHLDWKNQWDPKGKYVRSFPGSCRLK